MKLSFHSGLHKPNTCQHGPQVWEWWRLFWLHGCKLGYYGDGGLSGKRLWIYTRWWATYFDIVLDRRITQ